MGRLRKRKPIDPERAARHVARVTEGLLRALRGEDGPRGVAGLPRVLRWQARFERALVFCHRAAEER